MILRPKWVRYRLAAGAIDAKTEFGEGDFRRGLPRFAQEARDANLALTNLVRGLAEQKKISPAQLALAWLLARKPWIVPIPGTTKLSRLQENIGATEVDLTTDELHEIDEALSSIEVQGGRYPENLEKLINR